jgi:hypothetical protein
MIIDTDVVSYIYKKDTRAEKYDPHLVNAMTTHQDGLSFRIGHRHSIPFL